MLPTTIQAFAAIAKADPSVSPDDRNAIITFLRNHGQARGNATAPGNRVLKRREVAERLGVCPRTVDGLSRSGALRRVVLPGRQRGAGYVEQDVVRLIEDAAAQTEKGL